MSEKEPQSENSIDVTCAVIRKEGKVLIARRGPNKAYAGKWEFPGGRIELGETRESCLVREIFEELEMVVKVETPVLTWEYDYGGPNSQFRFFAFHCRHLNGDPQLKDHDDLRWVEISELPGFDLLEADKKLVEALLNSRSQ